jgi:hypothetical protein
MDEERPRKKGRVAAGAAGPGLVTHKVLNQGGFRTCVGYAFSLVMTTGLHEKYEIACDPDKFVEKVKALCPCWEGHVPELMLDKWNKKHARPGAAIEDVDQRKLYNVKVEYTKITSFEEARAEMERQEALKLLMLCTYSTDQQGHELHAVALRSTAPGRKMEGVNSWGANQPLVEINEANFCYAIRFDPLITAAAKSGGVKIACPPVRKMFSDRVQEQDDKRKKAEQAHPKILAARMYEQDDKRKKAERRKQDDKRKKAEQEQDDKRKKAERRKKGLQAKREASSSELWKTLKEEGNSENSPFILSLIFSDSEDKFFVGLLVLLLTYFCVSYISSHFFKSQYVLMFLVSIMLLPRVRPQADITPWTFFWRVCAFLLSFFCLSSFSEYLFKSQYTIVWVTAHFVNAFKYLWMFHAAEICRNLFFCGYPPISSSVLFGCLWYDGW